MRKLLCFAFLLYATFLYGCATQMEPPVDNATYSKKPWTLRKTRLGDKKSWNIQGAVSVTNRGKTQMGTFTWQQVYQRYTINIYGPLNLAGVGLQGSPGQVTLYKPTGTFTAPNAETLMQSQLGWYLPISNLYYWVRGLPAPGHVTKQEQDQYGHLVLLEQQGWTIQYQSFQSNDDTDLPRKIIMDNQNLHVKLVIKSWDLYSG